MKKIKNLMLPKFSEDFAKEIDLENIKNINIITLFIAFIEICGSIVAFFSIKNQSNYLRSAFQMSFCLLLCIVISFITNRAKKSRHINHRVMYSLVIVFYLIYIIWGAFVSYSHYIKGEQILTFYTVIIVLIAFVYMPPALGATLTFLSFLAFYLLLYRYDGAARVVLFNYLSFALVCCVASISKFHLIFRQLKSKKEISELNTTLKNAARHDYLTKIKNRFALGEDIEKYFGKPMAVVMCDLDKFKQINDSYGHIVGDKVICAIAEVFKNKVNESCIYRFGGDEFLVLTDNKPESELIASIDKIKSEIAEQTQELLNKPMTVSFGYAFGTANSLEEFEKLLNTADEMMYSKKNK